MDDQEYIREAIELIGGKVTDEYEDGFFFDLPLEHKDSIQYRQSVHSSWQWVHDVIAMQLARQVDALDNAWVESGPDAGAECSSMDLKKWGGSLVINDRAMNIIRAVVDSKVLTKGSKP